MSVFFTFILFLRNVCRGPGLLFFPSVGFSFTLVLTRLWPGGVWKRVTGLKMVGLLGGLGRAGLVGLNYVFGGGLGKGFFFTP